MSKDDLDWWSVPCVRDGGPCDGCILEDFCIERMEDTGEA